MRINHTRKEGFWSYGLSRELVIRHGGRLNVFSDKDWNRIKRVVKKYPNVLKELKALKVIMTPLVIKDYSGRIAK